MDNLFRANIPGDIVQLQLQRDEILRTEDKTRNPSTINDFLRKRIIQSPSKPVALQVSSEGTSLDCLEMSKKSQGISILLKSLNYFPNGLYSEYYLVGLLGLFRFSRFATESTAFHIFAVVYPCCSPST